VWCLSTDYYFFPPQWFWISLLFYCAGLLGAKITFLLQYYRILAVQHMRKVYIIAIVIIGAWGLAQVLIALLICRPIQGLWDKSVPADCMPNAPQIYVNAAGNIITDIAVFLLPMPAIKHLNLKRPQKVLLISIFSLGFLQVKPTLLDRHITNLRQHRRHLRCPDQVPRPEGRRHLGARRVVGLVSWRARVSPNLLEPAHAAAVRREVLPLDRYDLDRRKAKQLQPLSWWLRR
jgi:hypothetical protein